MAKVMNKKEEPLTLEETKNLFKKGVVVEQASSGLFLVGKKKNDKKLHWVNLGATFGDKVLPPMPPERPDYKAWCNWHFARDDLTDTVNRELWGIQAPIRMYAF